MSTRSYFCTRLSLYKSTCTTYFYIVLGTMLKFFCPNGRTQHIISVVYEDQCASDLFDERTTISSSERRPDVCAHTYLSPHDCAHKIVPTRLCPHTFVPRHVCAHTRLCPHTFVPTHGCAQTRLCPHMFVPRHICSLTCYNLVVTIMSGPKRVRLCPETYFVP